MKKTKYKDSDLLKDRLLWFTSIGLTTLLLLSLMLSAAIAQQDDKGDVVAIVTRINGALDFRENATSDWKQAKTKEALYNGYQIRTETGIAEKAVSISYAAVELATKVFGHLEGRVVLLVGAGVDIVEGSVRSIC